MVEHIKQENCIDLVKLNHDTNGNPRYAMHYLNIKVRLDNYSDYESALTVAKAIGGRKYHNKRFGGWIVFQSYNLDHELELINRINLIFDYLPWLVHDNEKYILSNVTRVELYRDDNQKWITIYGNRKHFSVAIWDDKEIRLIDDNGNRYE